MQFTRESAQRIANVVRTSEVTPLPASPLTFKKQFRDKYPQNVKIATYAGNEDWLKGQTRAVSFLEGGTVEVINNIENVILSGNITYCVIVRDSGNWYLINSTSGCPASLNVQAKELDYDSIDSSGLGNLSPGDGVQVLVNAGGCAKWFSLKRQQLVTNVAWQDGIVVLTKDFYVFTDDGNPADTEIVSATECE